MFAGSLKLRNVVLDKCGGGKIAFTGAGIYAESGSNVEIADSTISNSNSLGNWGAAIGVYAGSELTISNSYIVNNTGASVVDSTRADKIKIYNSKFIGNTSPNPGGILYVYQVASSLIFNNVFTKNKAGGGEEKLIWCQSFPTLVAQMYFYSNNIGTDKIKNGRENEFNNLIDRCYVYPKSDSDKPSDKK